MHYPVRKLLTFIRLIRTSLALSRSVTERKSSLTDFCQHYSSLFDGMRSNSDLGCGNNPQNPFNLVIYECRYPLVRLASLMLIFLDSYTFLDESVAVVTAFTL